MKSKSKSKRALLIILGAFVVLLVAFRLYLPTLVLRVVNKKLTQINGYTGHVHDIDIRLILGSYRIKNIELNKIGGKIPVPFFSADVIDISLEWKALLKGAIVGEIEAQKPILNFVKGPTEATSQTHIDKKWQDVVDQLVPLRLNRFQIYNGEIHFRDFYSTPKINLLMKNVEIVAENLTNVNDKKDILPSSAKATAFIYGGMATVNMKLNPLEKIPTFDLNAELTQLNIVDLNDFLRAYGNFDVHKGTISIYAEAAAKNNELTGYTKPIIKDLKVVDFKKDKGNIVELAWKGLIGLSAWTFKNHPKDQLATEVTFQGNLQNPDIDLWSIIGETLQNAFIHALAPAIENSISINTPLKKKDAGFLKKVFGGKENSDNLKTSKSDTRKTKREKRRERRSNNNSSK